jgi:hypothetical protein
LSCWIRIWVKEGKKKPKMTHKKEKSKEISCFELLDVLFLGLKASPVAWDK